MVRVLHGTVLEPRQAVYARVDTCTTWGLWGSHAGLTMTALGFRAVQTKCVRMQHCLNE